MRKMRIGIIFVCVAFALALCGCAQREGASAALPAGTFRTVSAAGALPGPNTAGETETVELAAATDWYWFYQDDKLLSVSTPVLMLADEEQELNYPELAAALKRINAEKDAEAGRLFEELKGVLSDPYVEELYSEIDYTAQRSDTRFVSVLLRTEAYLGGVHPSRDYQAVNLNTQTGEPFDLSDVSSDPGALLQLAAADLCAAYPDMEFLEAPEEALPEAYRAGWLCWTVGYEGVSFYFAGGYISSYADGDLEAFVPFAGNEDLFTADVLSAPASYAYAFSWAARIPDRVTGDPAFLIVDGIAENPEYDMYDYVSVEWLGTKTMIEEFCYSIRPFYLHTEKGDYLYLETTSEDDYRTLHVYDLTAGAFVGEPLYDTGFAGVHRDQDMYARLIAFDPSVFTLWTGLDVLSTYQGVKSYTVGGDGVPVTDDAYYAILGRFVLTVIREIPALDASGGAIRLPAGTELVLTQTDGKTVVFAETSGGIVRIEGEFASYPQNIGGVDIEECFDGMMFAG